MPVATGEGCCSKFNPSTQLLTRMSRLGGWPQQPEGGRSRPVWVNPPLPLFHDSFESGAAPRAAAGGVSAAKSKTSDGVSRKSDLPRGWSIMVRTAAAQARYCLGHAKESDNTWKTGCTPKLSRKTS